MKLNSAVCLVTGATSGIGRATALSLISPHVGARVVALGRDASGLDALSTAARREGDARDRIVRVRADLS